MKRWLLRFWLGFLVALLVLVQQTPAQVCKVPSPQVQKIQAAVKYLRRLSLDLRGRAPSYAELNKVVQQGHVDDSTIDDMLNSDLFRLQMREYLKDLLTLNITDLRLQGGFRISPYVKINSKGEVAKRGETSTLVIDRGTAGARAIMRGQAVHCLPEKARYDQKTGDLLCKIRGTSTYKSCLTAYNERRAGKKNVAQEGYVMVKPYWEKDPSKTVAVCGLAALNKKQPKVGNTTYYCATDTSNHVGGRIHQILCGCGPHLEWCFRGGEGNTPDFGSMNTEIMTSMMEQTLRVMDKIVKDDKPYTDLLLTKDAEINGHLSHFINKNTRSANRLTLPSKKEFQVPALPYYEGTKWVKFTRTTREAGILTLPFFLFKYATNRGRLHRYHNAFLCQYFTPPAGGLPDPTNKCHQEPNLMKRCGCKFCHTTIEPEASHWGRWQENAWFPLNATAFPKTSAACAKTTGSKPGYCKSLYMVEPKHKSEEAYRGQLLAYVFATPTMEQNITKGPASLIQRDINNGKIYSCAVKKMWSWYTGSDLQSQQDHVQNDLMHAFQSNKYSIKSLVKAIVKTEEYRHGFDSHQP